MIVQNVKGDGAAAGGKADDNGYRFDIDAAHSCPASLGSDTAAGLHSSCNTMKNSHI